MSCCWLDKFEKWLWKICVKIGSPEMKKMMDDVPKLAPLQLTAVPVYMSNGIWTKTYQWK